MPPTIPQDLRREAVNTIRMLAVDAIEKARSGHPGAPMGQAEMALALWTEFLRFDPAEPDWENRDRFVLSSGHGSMLLYALLHLSGYGVSLDDLKRFRQWGSATPGHPEYGVAPGVEVTTGPLGQGFANGIGIALAGRMLAARFAGGGWSPIDYRVFGIVSDGDIMEGVSAEAASLAGHLRLGNVVYLYDDNRITIEGSTRLAFSEDVAGRFRAYGWTAEEVDGDDPSAIRAAIARGIAEAERPSLIVARTTIGHGSPTKQGTSEVHGSPLGAEEVRRTKEALGWPLEPTFRVPDAVRALFEDRAREGAIERAAWRRRLDAWLAEDAERASAWAAHWERRVPADLLDRLVDGLAGASGATRTLSGRIIQKAARLVPALVGGSADLDPSTNTAIVEGGEVGPIVEAREALDLYRGRTLHFGVREHAMGAIVNGLALSGAFIPYGATFLVFSDYMRPAIRLSALSGLPAVFVFTHDSIFLGEDGPTHEPVEQLASLRAIPGLTLFRPADGVETAAAWAWAIRRAEGRLTWRRGGFEHGAGPTLLSLTRQKLPGIERPASFRADEVLRGGYVVANAEGGRAAAVVIATGSEVWVALEARKILAARGTPVCVVSMPCVEIFERQPQEYRRSILPPGLPVVALEAGSPLTWRRFVGPEGLAIGVERFGASAPYEVLAEKFGLTPPAVAERIASWLEQRRSDPR
jgi:transketolase